MLFLFKKSPDNIISTTPSDDIIKVHKNGIKESRKGVRGSEGKENCMQPIQFYVPITTI